MGKDKEIQHSSITLPSPLDKIKGKIQDKVQ